MNAKKTVRVLVVDDSPVALVAICTCLETDPGIEIVGIAKSGFELPAMAEQLQPDVIVTDLHMPRMNGLEVTLSLRLLMPSTRFIVITDVPSPQDALADRGGTIDRYLGKNTKPEEVLAEIRRLFPAVENEAAGGTVEGQHNPEAETKPRSDSPSNRGPAPSARRPSDKCEAGYC